MHFTDKKKHVIEKSENRQSKVLFDPVAQYTFAAPQNKIPLKPMKNFTLLLVAFLIPFFGFSQVDLVKWNKANLTSSNLQAGASGGTITSSGGPSVYAETGWGDPTFIQTTGWPQPIYSGPGVSFDANKYVQFTLTANSTNTLTLSSLDFSCRTQGNTVNYQMRYSKSSTFASGVTQLVNETTVGTTWTSIPTNSFSNLSLSPGETIYIRLYVYNSNDNFHLRFSEGNLGPAIKGTLTTSCAPPTNTQAFGSDSWNGFVYTYADNNTDFSTATYIGTVTESKNFFRDMAAGQVAGATTNIPCVTPPSDRFMIRYKMTTPSLVAGQYNFTVGADDGYRLYIDGALQTDLSDFTDHGYNQKSKTITLSAGAHNLIYEYYEKTGDATVMFSYGKVDASSFPFGNNVWNVYAFNSDTNATASTYAGSYVDSNLGINTEAFWANGTSPSATSTYSGAPVPKDYFTTVFKRKGFPCGKFSIKLNKFDDDVVIILNGTQIESRTGTGTNYVLPNNYILKPTDEIEVRLVERGGAAFLNMAFIDVPTVYSASSTPTAAQVLGTSMRVEKNFSITENLNVCSCTVTNGYTLTIPENKTITIQEGVTVENTGNLIVENNGSLVQVNDNTTNSGSIKVQRTTAPVKRYDFTYWSSPVGSGFTLNNLSPNTLGDKYYSYNPVSGWVIHYNGNQAMEAGKGYLVRAPQEYDINNPVVYNATFVGKPNNGIITQPIVANASNLIGNPYPSAISADAIYSANSGVIDGTFYFWTHNTLPSTANSGSATYNYSSDDYASYNGVGGVKTKSAVTGGQTPTGNIASGQSFFIAGKTSGNVTFSNSMRVKAGNNSQFFKTSNTTQSEQEPATIEKNRLWLNISNEAGDFNETLIGYVSNATNGLDQAFDGVNLSSGTTTLYSIIDTNNLVIQGRALPFTNTDVVPLGMKISTAGQYTINMDQFDGLFTSQNIYLFDSVTNTTHDLKASDYVFNSEIGTFNSRFEIRYVNGTELGIDTPIVTNNDVIVYKSGNQIAVKATNFTIDNIQVYDLTGKVIFSKAKVNSNDFITTGLNVGTQVVIVKVNLDNNQSVSKKVIMN